MTAMIRFQEGHEGGLGMFNQIAIEAVQWEREREIQEAVRRRRLLAGDGPDPDVALAAVAARSVRRERRVHPVRLATP
jgi:hypothetical protein